MSINPYEAPQTVSSPPATDGSPVRADSTLAIVRAQRGMMWLWLAKLGLDFAFSAAPDMLGPALSIAYYIPFLAVSIAIAYFVFRITHLVYGIGPALVCTLLAFLPCAGTITVLILNGQTMDRLRKLGVKVGFMGATRQQLEELTKRQSEQANRR
jgi:hypothetical protein